ncbi:carboxypeptidase-like regulatory domain-containing protein [Ekhidna sp.]
MKRILCAMFILLWLSAESQEFLTISGKVIDKKSQETLSFATIGLKKDQQGTITNLDGEFSFSIPKENAADTLFVRYLGYETYRASVSSMLEEKNVIQLEESVVQLAEVEVNNLTADQIMQKVFERMPENYSTDPFVIKGFFRDIRNQNDQSSYLVESAVEVYDPGIKMNKEGNKKERRSFFIKDMRASENKINELLTPVLNRFNFLHFTLENNWYKYYAVSLKPSSASHYELKDIIHSDGSYLFVIRLEEQKVTPGNDSSYVNLSYTLETLFYVDSETYAIHKIVHTEIPINETFVAIEPPYPGDSLYYRQKGWKIVREYGEYRGKMYPKYISQIYPFDIYNKKQDRVYLDLAFHMTFVTTDVQLENVKRPTGGKALRGKDLMLQTQKYNPAFWSNKQNVKLVPLTQKQIQGLEREKSLEEQFRFKKTKSKK